MRIIAGTYRGRKIDFPKTPDIRPTQDRIREALFNVIAPDIEGRKVLDLFAGSGSLGIEALSRGAKKVTFVDNNLKCIKIIKKNLEGIGITAEAEVYKQDAFKAIERLSASGASFDIVFIDPPYYKDLAKKALIKLTHYVILSHNNIIVVEHYKKDALPEDLKGMALKKQKRFGDIFLSFYVKSDIGK